MTEKMFETEYGHFAHGGRAYVITRPDTPRPWVNVIANQRYGLIISQAGGGFSWIDHSTLSVLTRWEMDLVRDAWGKWLHLRDDETGDLWSAAPQPTMAALDGYECRHGLGHTTLALRAHGIESEWTLTVPADATLELWRLRLRNHSDRTRRLTVGSHLMWCLGAAPDAKREFHRLFIETAFDPKLGGITAQKCLWEIPDKEFGHWNVPWPHTAFHTAWIPGSGPPPDLRGCGDHEQFLGRHGDQRDPAWISGGAQSTGGFGRHGDAIAALATSLEIPAGGERSIMFALGAADSPEAIAPALAPFRDVGAMDRVIDAVDEMWRGNLDAVHTDTPDDAFNLMTNTWLPYQAITARLWARAGYWQQSGAFGFRDQLQDSQVFLPQAPARCLEQVRLHARHQFADGTVYHWWHPLSEVGLRTEMTDDLLWLPFVLISLLKETGDLEALNHCEPFVDSAEKTTLWDHGVRAIERVLARFSPRGLPLIGEGDWNDGMSACGLKGRGESVWLGHFLHGILREWSDLAQKRGDTSRAAEWLERSEELCDALNTHGWDGDWYLRATLDDGSPLGSHTCREGRIFLNAQTWAVIAGVAEGNRAEQVMDAVEEHLLREFGPILFTPAFTAPDARVGYLTRYAPGTRENGGLYTHAATWAIQAAAMLGRAETAWAIFSRLAPPNRGMNPEHFSVEPYVTPGNVDGPESPHFGRGGWTWYTGSAAWLRRVALEWILGIRPTWEGLVISPCLPSAWSEVRHMRPFRGDMFEISISNPSGLSGGAIALEVDGQFHPAGEPIPSTGCGSHRRVCATVVPSAVEMTRR